MFRWIVVTFIQEREKSNSSVRGDYSYYGGFVGVGRAGVANAASPTASQAPPGCDWYHSQLSLNLISFLSASCAVRCKQLLTTGKIRSSWPRPTKADASHWGQSPEAHASHGIYRGLEKSQSPQLAL